jgi:hypothetical protein
MNQDNATSSVVPPPPPTSSLASKPRRSRGYLNPRAVRGFAFVTITLCILASVVVSILAIWNPDQTDVLMKTVATSIVIAAGCGLLAAVNTSLGGPADEQ